MPDVIEQALTAVAFDRSRLMDVIHQVIEQKGRVEAVDQARIAAGLGLHRGEVRDMLSFYAFFSARGQGRVRIRISRTPLSLIKGAEEVAAALSAALHTPLGGVSEDGRFGLLWAGDLGLADQEVALMVNNSLLAGVTPADVPAIVEALRALDDSGPPPVFPLAGSSWAQIHSGLVQSGPLLASKGRSDALRRALLDSPQGVIEEVLASGLRGRGGAGFPTGMKWKFCRQAQGERHYVVCNADEGEPGTFKDRVLLREAPELLLAGMSVAGYALGARQGLIYLRGEYAFLLERLQQALAKRRRQKLLGENILGSDFSFDIRIQLGAGAYICGEESALLESLEGKRGAPRDRPPFPTDQGYLKQPTAVNNVETYCCVARILQRGAQWFRGLGTRESAGTKLLSVAGDCLYPGVYEVEFGITVRQLLERVGAIDAAFVQVGGPSGQTVAPKDYGRQIAYEDLSTGGSIMVFGAERDVLRIALQHIEFLNEESCGWCAPCRVGTTLMRERLQSALTHGLRLQEVQALEQLAGRVGRLSRCGLGQAAPNPVLSSMRSFPQAWERLLRDGSRIPAFDLDAALAPAQALRAAGH